MTTVILGFAGMLLIVLFMSVGVIFGRKPIAGSCGGLAQLGLNGECEICGGTPDDCLNTPDSEPADNMKMAKLSYKANSNNFD
ncbi:MAG: (Na+)-NQR maturation NqrM [Pseudomonadales bacterium]|nr:(Na+)-NQR maturation NqrM [Pseudomonadales bacterium]